MGLSDSRSGPRKVICSPAGSVPNHRRSGSPRFLGRSFRARRPQPPRQARRPLAPVSSSPAAGFATASRLAAPRLNLTRPNRIHLRYGSRVRPAGLRRCGSLRTPPAPLPVERAIDRAASSRAARSTRLGLAHLLRFRSAKTRFFSGNPGSPANPYCKLFFPVVFKNSGRNGFGGVTFLLDL